MDARAADTHRGGAAVLVPVVVGLTAAGVPAPEAVAATLVYRLASQWLVVPIGWVSWWADRADRAGR